MLDLYLLLTARHEQKYTKIYYKCLLFHSGCKGTKKIRNMQKKRKDVISTSQSLLNLKSNTMKNTMQNYCFSAILPNIFREKTSKYTNFHHFAIYRLQNTPVFTFSGIKTRCFNIGCKSSKWPNKSHFQTLLHRICIGSRNGDSFVRTK